jgi:hypothetical protein
LNAIAVNGKQSLAKPGLDPDAIFDDGASSQYDDFVDRAARQARSIRDHTRGSIFQFTLPAVQIGG